MLGCQTEMKTIGRSRTDGLVKPLLVRLVALSFVTHSSSTFFLKSAIVVSNLLSLFLDSSFIVLISFSNSAFSTSILSSTSFNLSSSLSTRSSSPLTAFSAYSAFSAFSALERQKLILSQSRTGWSIFAKLTGKALQVHCCKVKIKGYQCLTLANIKSETWHIDSNTSLLLYHQSGHQILYCAQPESANTLKKLVI